MERSCHLITVAGSTPVIGCSVRHYPWHAAQVGRNDRHPHCHGFQQRFGEPFFAESGQHGDVNPFERVLGPVSNGEEAHPPIRVHRHDLFRQHLLVWFISHQQAVNARQRAGRQPGYGLE